jgi:hypothetical protein
VVRIGDTVRRPLKPDSERTHRLLAHFERNGFDGASRFLGMDAQGRAIRDMIPVAIIDWDGTCPGSRVSNLGEFLWAFVHPAVYGEGEAAARMLRVAAHAYGCRQGVGVASQRR